MPVVVSMLNFFVQSDEKNMKGTSNSTENLGRGSRSNSAVAGIGCGHSNQFVREICILSSMKCLRAAMGNLLPYCLFAPNAVGW